MVEITLQTTYYNFYEKFVICLTIAKLFNNLTDCELSNIYRKYLEGGQFTKDIGIDGKVVIITGCNTGIGKETALDVAKRGARVYMACRSFAKCEAARKEIIEKSGNENVFNMELDLSSMESVRDFVNA